MSFRSLNLDNEQSTENLMLHRELYRQRSNSTPNISKNATADLNAKDSKGRTLLFYAAKYGQTQIARQLLDAGCDPNIADRNKNTALHEATDGSHIDVIKLLVKRGCDLNAKNLLGQTPLMRAVLFDDIETVKLLHKAGAYIDEFDCTGKTALLIGLQEGRDKSCVYLIKQGCEVNIVDKLGQSTLFLATHNRDKNNQNICKKLISAGYNLENDIDWIPKDFPISKCSKGRNLFDRVKTIFGQRKTCKIEFQRKDEKEIYIPNFRVLDICA